MNLKYVLGFLFFFPCLPIMYAQARRIKKRIPKFGVAKGDHGIAKAEHFTERTLNLITIGESTFAGIGVETHEEGFCGTLAKELACHFNADVHWKVYAKSGYNLQQITNKVVSSIEETAVDLIAVGIGGNDSFQLANPITWRKNIEELIYKLQLKFPQALIVFSNMPPIKEFPIFTSLIKLTVGNLVELLGQELEDVARQHERVIFQSEIISIEKWNERFDLSGTASDYFSDGVHPSKLAYQIWAKSMALEIASQPESYKIVDELIAQKDLKI